MLEVPKACVCRKGLVSAVSSGSACILSRVLQCADGTRLSSSLGSEITATAAKYKCKDVDFQAFQITTVIS